ncbi:hypothetical protein BJD55_gp146 [Gordonia phage Yvonnetastic]|uniref:Uncharacterized protein n=1 Tax=Gordonia phage Yvonnetastic TaxID=1821566 RepID=A0A142K937_9CAUD|nr:hypothetical protein BJD55_gp146 [Gordonia phage Yvonnetastic]AMS02620.1 hypothetical protein SEA_YVONNETASTIC_76 [Gordonia phage Yvonnetastic]WKW86052.1 hypothetical protein SEA_JONJAMES_78 [Gordonia Phage JonJames]
MSVVAAAAWGGLRIIHHKHLIYGDIWQIEVKDSYSSDGWSHVRVFHDWSVVRDWWHNNNGRDLGVKPKVSE